MTFDADITMLGGVLGVLISIFKYIIAYLYFYVKNFLNNNTNSLIFLLNKIIYATTHQKRMGILDWYIGTEL